MLKKILYWTAKKTLWILGWALCSTLRISRNNVAPFEQVGRQHGVSVLAFWHGSMLIGWFVHRPAEQQTVAAVVSRSEDGELLSSTLERWGYQMIRGSSRVGGKETMQSMVDAVERGNSLCLTPDGPTGPRHEMKMGAVRAAQRAGVPLFLVGIAADRKKTLKSWDRFEIPLPFASVSLWYSDPIAVSRELRDEALDAFLRRVEGRMRELQENAERSLLTV